MQRVASSESTSISVGSTVEGTIVKLTEYGAIVKLQGGKTGLIHISEIADTFVRDIRDYFKEHERVRVKVLSVNEKGRYELSTKNVDQLGTRPALPPRPRPTPKPSESIDLGPEPPRSTRSHESQAISFEDRLTQFMKDSQERLLELKRNLDAKRGIRRR